MTDTATQAGKIQPRLKTKYRNEISKALTEEHGYTNVHQVPGLVKIVVNMGVGEAARDGKVIDGAIADLTKITGQKPQVTKARKSIAQFKLREGQPIGAHVTLRGDRMWEFLDRLLSLALPRIRDFRGLSDEQFDGNGNYTFGLTEQSRVPRDRPGQDRPRPRHGHHRGDHRQDRRRGPRAAQAARLPVQVGRRRQLNSGCRGLASAASDPVPASAGADTTGHHSCNGC